MTKAGSAGRDAGTGTIFAMASGAGRAAISVMRLSGTDTLCALQRLLGGAELPFARRASLRRLRDADGALLDQAMVLWLPGPHSYTGEDSAELHLHAGPAVIEAVSHALLATGARPAQPGEFTRRAFLNGRMTLTEAEAVADLLAAETQAQRHQALLQLEGGLGRMFEDWSERLRSLLAQAEARIDFPDETADEIAADPAPLHDLIAAIESGIAGAGGGRRLRDGLVFAIIGAPNAGKSTLFNALAGWEAAIVSLLPGTTRDVLEIRVVLGDVPVLLLDTAGLRDSDDQVESEGIRRARQAAERADCTLVLLPPGLRNTGLRDLGLADTGLGDLGLVGTGVGDQIAIASKTDLEPAPPGMPGISAASGAGMTVLHDMLSARARAMTAASSPAPMTRARHQAACTDAVAHLRAALVAPADEFRAEALRLALRSLGEVTGKVGTEDVLDSVFSQFCIGK